MRRNALERASIPTALTDELVNKRKLQIDTRLKAAARMKPRKYGDSSTVNLTSKGDKLPVAASAPITPETLAEAMKLFKGSL